MAGAIFAYPMIENAIRGNRGRTIADHGLEMGKLFSGFAAVAAGNPLADRRQGFSAEQIATVGSDNPYIGFPYTKLMNSNAFIDQSAAIILTSVAKAKELGIPKEKWVYLHGCADAYDHWYLSDRKNFHSSPAMSKVAQEAFEMANSTLDDMAALDLYSCFPAAIKIFSKSLGLDNQISKTITGSMAYAGGPLNSFVLHSTVKMIQKIRTSEVSHGLVTGVSGMMTKQSFCVWGKEYQEQFIFNDVTDQAKLNEIPVELSTITEGEGEIIGYTIIEEDESAQKAVLYVDDEKKDRKVVSSHNKIFINLLMEEEWVGKKVKFKDGQVVR